MGPEGRCFEKLNEGPFLSPLPEVGCQIFLEIRNPWGKVMERNDLTFEHFFWKWSKIYPHWLRELVSPVCVIFSNESFNFIFWLSKTYSFNPSLKNTLGLYVFKSLRQETKI